MKAPTSSLLKEKSNTSSFESPNREIVLTVSVQFSSHLQLLDDLISYFCSLRKAGVNSARNMSHLLRIVCAEESSIALLHTFRKIRVSMKLFILPIAQYPVLYVCKL